jgi:hypothetical protein
MVEHDMQVGELLDLVDLLGIADDTAKIRHFGAVTIDQHEGRLAGITDTAPTILGRR